MLMTHDVNKTASDWVAYASYTGPNNVPDEIFAGAWALYDLVQDSPDTAWEVLKAVIDQYPEKDFYAVERSEAQEVVGRLAAGPLEDLLSAFGVNFIGVVEAEARRDRRIAWTVGGVWQAEMTDDIWARVQRVADYTYWERPAIE
jgi:hypothetical protein